MLLSEVSFKRGFPFTLASLLLFCLTLVAAPQPCLADQQALLDKLNRIADMMAACGNDPGCVAKYAAQAEALQKQLAASGLGPTACWEHMRDNACAATVPPYSCIPVAFEVTGVYYLNDIAELCYPQGQLPPDYCREYTATRVNFVYTATGWGELRYHDDYQDFMLMGCSAPETNRIVELSGEWGDVNYDLNMVFQRPYTFAGAKVRNPASIAISHPPGEWDLNSNIHVYGTEIETLDEYHPTLSGADLNPGYDLGRQVFITPEILSQYVTQGGFQEEFRWREDQPVGGHKEIWTDYVVSLKVKFREACDNGVKVSIIEPKTTGDENKFCFSDAKPGKLTMTLKATTTPKQYEKDIQWEVPEIKGSLREVTPKSMKGPTLTVTYTGLPKDNDEFGKKQIKAYVKKDSCTSTDSREVSFFYFRDEKNNPDGNVPNWFYYWAQTPAGRPHGQQVDLIYGGVTYLLCKDKGVTGVFDGNIAPDKLAVCDLPAKLGPHLKLVYPLVSRQQPATLTTKHMGKAFGIDAFAQAVVHEFEHMRLFHNVIKPRLPMLDQDGDGLPDDAEPGMQLDPKKFQTYWGNDPQFKNIGGDEEFLCYEAMSTYAPGVNDQYDWALPGKNWPVK